MRFTTVLFERIFLLVVMALVGLPLASASEDPCANAKHRALVMSGGGAKGAFETGAVYHLVVQRHCDFHEFSGSSVGALNGAFLAQAERSAEASDSLSNLVAQTEGLVSLWQSIKSSNDIRKQRRLATVRFGLFGLDSMNDMTPLRQLLNRNISMEKLAKGRPVRAGVVSFWSGEYREVVAHPPLEGGGTSFLDYVYASSVLPVYGKLPRIPDGSASDDPKLWPQFTDGGLRHITPLGGYFHNCKDLPASDPSTQQPVCVGSMSVPAHEPVEQLFVIVTSPYSRDSDALPMSDANCCRPGTRQISDGRKILGRTLELMDDAVYRSDLDFTLTANEIVRWRRQAYDRLVLNAPLDRIADARREFTGFALESYSRDSQDADAPSRPYDIALIVPKKEFADPAHLLMLSPEAIQDQLYCGCIAADEMMTRDYEQPSLSGQCAERFPVLHKQKQSTRVPMANRSAALCGLDVSGVRATEVALR
jgi:Patatin-like phospholipase